jgi:hypothetical protein
VRYQPPVAMTAVAAQLDSLAADIDQSINGKS